jgi:hypothetical protein
MSRMYTLIILKHVPADVGLWEEIAVHVILHLITAETLIPSHVQ